MIDPDIHKPETDATPRRSFQDYALILFYGILVLIAMGGWIWLLTILASTIIGG